LKLTFQEATFECPNILLVAPNRRGPNAESPPKNHHPPGGPKNTKTTGPKVKHLAILPDVKFSTRGYRSERRKEELGGRDGAVRKEMLLNGPHNGSTLLPRRLVVEDTLCGSDGQCQHHNTNQKEKKKKTTQKNQTKKHHNHAPPESLKQLLSSLSQLFPRS